MASYGEYSMPQSIATVVFILLLLGLGSNALHHRDGGLVDTMDTVTEALTK